MNIKLKRLVLGIASFGALGLYGCGGGGSSAVDSGNPVAPVIAATVDVPITVIDGPIQNAQVCLDKNDNGVCDAGEPTGSTDAEGKVTLKVDAADKGQYPVIAVVGTDAIDADTGKVPTAFTMKAPKDQSAVITPLTTLVQNVVASTGSTSAAAAEQVQAQTGINVNLFEDFSKGSTDDHKAAANIARMVVVTTQQQSEAVKSAEGTKDADGGTIRKADLDKAIQARLMEMLPALVTKLAENQTQIAALEKALTDAKAVIDASAKKVAVEKAQKDKDDALKAKMTEVVVTENKGLTSTGVATNVAVSKQQESSAPVVAETPNAGFNIRELSFTDLSNYFVRFHSSTVLQNTPVKDYVRYVDNRYKSVEGVVAAWNTGSNPARQADLHWNGTTWVACQLNFEGISSVRDTKGNSEYNYCDNLETGKSSRASLDISGKKMVDALGDAVKAGYTNLGSVTDGTKALLGDASFPAKSAGFYQNGTSLTTAVAFNPGSDNRVLVETSLSCANTNTEKYAVTLEEVIAKYTGLDKCSGNKRTFTNGIGTSLNSGDRNEGWGNTTVSLGTIGSALANYTDSTATAYYTTNTRLRAGLGANGAATFYSCKERYNGSTRNCDVIGTGKYSVKIVGDARTLSFTGLPALASALSYTRVFVERGGKVYYGYQNRPMASNKAGLNTVASAALLAKLGLPAVNVDTPLALTLASYQGDWDAYPDNKPGERGDMLNISAQGKLTCSTWKDETKTAMITYNCALTSFDPSSGQIAWTDSGAGGGAPVTVTATLSFINGTGSASASDGGSAKLVRR
jgi:hypothetical protein